MRGNIMRTTTIRFTGLASGLDTESMVEAMLTPQKAKVDSAIQQQKLLELKKDAWKEMNSKIYSFYKDTLGPLRLSNTFNQKNVTLSQSNIIEIENKGSFPDGTHKIKVENLAEGALVKTKKITVHLDKDSKPIKDFDGDGKLDDKVTKQTKLADLEIKVGEKITINGQEPPVEITQDMTIGDLEAKFKAVGISTNFDEKAQSFFISSKGTGANEKITLSSTDSNALKNLGIELSNEGTYEYSGRDALIRYNDVEVTSSTNVISVNGMSIKLLAASTQEVTAISQTDINSIVDTVVKFVDEYNKLIETMSEKINADYNKDYLPLTDEQKKEMSEDDIKLWNKKIDDSILRKDPILQAITSSMREIIGTTSYTDSNNKKFTLQSFGITTSKNWNEAGKLYIDEEKLRKTVGENPDAFKGLFTNRVETTGTSEGDKKKAIEKSGIGVRLYEDISNRLKGSTIKSAEFLFNDKQIDKQIKSQKEEVAKLEDRMTSMENLYYKQFTAMEKMLSQLNTQSSWLTSQMGGI